MNSLHCCHREPRADHDAPQQKTWLRRAREAAGWIVPGAVLAVKVGGVLYKHTFSADEFRAIGNADAFECVASINAAGHAVSYRIL